MNEKKEIDQEEINRIPGNATNPKILEDRIMNASISKTESEWWAKREIEKLRENQSKSVIIGNPTIKKLRNGETVTFPLTNPYICLIPDDELFNKSNNRKRGWKKEKATEERKWIKRELGDLK